MEETGLSPERFLWANLCGVPSLPSLEFSKSLLPEVNHNSQKQRDLKVNAGKIKTPEAASELKQVTSSHFAFPDKCAVVFIFPVNTCSSPQLPN